MLGSQIRSGAALRQHNQSYIDVTAIGSSLISAGRLKIDLTNSLNCLFLRSMSDPDF